MSYRTHPRPAPKPKPRLKLTTWRNPETELAKPNTKHMTDTMADLDRERRAEIEDRLRDLDKIDARVTNLVRAIRSGPMTTEQNFATLDIAYAMGELGALTRDLRRLGL